MTTLGSKELYLVFAQGDERYAMTLQSVDEVLEQQPLGFVPQAPQGCLGALVHKGQVVAVLDSACILNPQGRNGTPAAPDEGPLTRLILVGYGESRFALRVDRVLRIAPLTSAPRAPMEGETRGDETWLGGVSVEPDGLLNLIDPAALAETVDRVFQR